MSDYSRKLLQKFGWKEGEGLGKNGDGIAEPVKVKYKRDTLGVGYSHVMEDGDIWWAAEFNRAADSISVHTTMDSVSLATNDDNTGSGIKGRCYDNHRRSLIYRGFLPSCITQHYHGNNKQNKHEVTVKVAGGKPAQQQRKLRDRELLKACGGRTAHKAARHGMRLSGKLKRLQAQEDKYLNSCHDNNDCVKHSPHSKSLQ